MPQRDLTTIISLIPTLLEVFNNCGSRRRRKQAIREMRDFQTCCRKLSAAMEMAGDDLPLMADLDDLKKDLQDLAK